MKITIESTPTVITIDGVPVRLWEGVTEDGTPCRVFVHRIAVAPEADHAAFERELRSEPVPDEICSLHGTLAAKVMPDGRLAEVIPLLGGRGRLVIGVPKTQTYDTVW